MSAPAEALEPVPPADLAGQLRRAVYGLLIALSVGSVVGRILAVDSVDMFGLESHLYKRGREDWQKSRPFLSANDRSRWDTVRSLVEDGTYAIDNIVAQPGWDTIDMVQHRGRDGEKHLYSSKPPLLATLMAAPYWVIYHTTGMSLGEYPYEIGRGLLLLYNVPLLVVYFLILGALADRFGTTDWGRMFLMAAGTAATFLSTFAVSVTNHLPAAVAAAASLWAAARIWYDDERRWPWFALAGFSAAFAFACELPALAWLALLSAALLWKAPGPTLRAYLPAALVVVVALFGTNYLAHDSLREPYAHRSATDPEDNWYHFTYTINGRERTSYWTSPAGIDQGEPSPEVYAFNVLVGHHGIFSLTPIWLLSVVGCGMWLCDPRRRALAASIGLVSLVCLAFYLSRPQIDRNYGGMTSGLRWMFWFAPLWLVLLLPAADWLARRRWGRGIALVLLALSVMSASYPTWNPWTSPWIQNAWRNWGE